MRERGNIWPVITVIAAALCVLVIVPLLIERQKAGRMATVDAYVSIGDGEVSDGLASAASNYRWPNGEQQHAWSKSRYTGACLEMRVRS
jgi:hypothetical protein